MFNSTHQDKDVALYHTSNCKLALQHVTMPENPPPTVCPKTVIADFISNHLYLESVIIPAPVAVYNSELQLKHRCQVCVKIMMVFRYKYINTLFQIQVCSYMSYNFKAKQQKRKEKINNNFLKVCSNLQVKGAVNYFYFEVF